MAQYSPAQMQVPLYVSSYCDVCVLILLYRHILILLYMQAHMMQKHQGTPMQAGQGHMAQAPMQQASHKVMLRCLAHMAF